MKLMYYDSRTYLTGTPISSNREVNAREFLVLLNREGNRNLSNTTQ